MNPSFFIQAPFDLARYNTFGIEAQAARYLALFEPDDLPRIARDPLLGQELRLVLGGGSNIILTGDFPGLVLHMRLPGMKISGETAESVLVSAAAGENWHALVNWSLQQGLGGLENLSLIPGTVGAAPIQNIGAYGAELQQNLHGVTFFDWQAQAFHTLTREQCRFAYRDSIFKHELAGRAVITEVVLALPKQWQANLQYRELAHAVAADADPLTPQTPLTPQRISDTVCRIRRGKLPDPAQLGNAGSFFKNPIVAHEQYQTLLAQHPDLVAYPQADGRVKLAAGWLIERAGWKGKRLGPVGVYEKQALVLVNYGAARGEQLMALARQIQDAVWHGFGVQLEPEPVLV
jgi:UDP-N-acetylmuramate dehydrogenase